MYSKAKIGGHPVHPMLVAFPIALYTATVVSLVLCGVVEDVFWFRAAMTANIAGVIMAAIAMVPGSIDLFSGIPRHSPARATGLKHALAAAISNAAFLVSAILLAREWGARDRTAQAWQFDLTAPLIFSVIGLCAVMVAGWMGWRLVQNHLVGVGEGDVDELDDTELTDDEAIEAALPRIPPIPRRTEDDLRPFLR